MNDDIPPWSSEKIKPGKILRWSVVGANVLEEKAERILMLCRAEFPEVRFKISRKETGRPWIRALLLHEHGVGWGQRRGEGEEEIRIFAEAMDASARRLFKRENEERKKV